MSTSVQSLADAIAATARQQGATTPEVRGADWHTATVTAVNTDGTVDCGTIRARRLDSYLNPTVGDLIVISRSGPGNWIAAGRLATTTGTAWTSYTPTWTAATTNPTLGNGTLIGRYHKIGRTVVAEINLVPGSTTTFGSGAYSLALPFTVASSDCHYLGTAHLLASGDRWPGQFVVSTGNSTAQAFFATSSANCLLRVFSPTQPVTLASGHQLRITVVYESAT